MKIEKIEKHIANLRENFKIGIKSYINMRKVNKSITFNQKAWLKQYTDINTPLKNIGFVKSFFKFLGNGLYQACTKEEKTIKCPKQTNHTTNFFQIIY